MCSAGLRGTVRVGHSDDEHRSGEGTAKVLAIFNLLAGAASLAGLWLILPSDSVHPALIAIFAVTLLLVLYVLLVPGSAVEQNVAAKLERFRKEETGEGLVVQRGTFTIREYGPVTVEFYQPFARDGPSCAVGHADAHRASYTARMSVTFPRGLAEW